jgi:hypothetical protein
LPVQSIGSALPLVVFTNLRPIATILHVAPSASVVPARIQEQPAAPTVVRTLSHALQLP